MSQNATGSTHRSSSSSSQSRLNAAQIRAIRKELLILRSDVERRELLEAGSELREDIARFRWLKVLMPGMMGGSLGKSAKGLNTTLSQLVTQYPMLSSLASLVLAKPVRSLLRAGAGPVLKWGTLGFAAFEIYRAFKSERKDRDAANDD